MKNAEYWRDRFSILEDSTHRQSEQAIRNIEKMYMEAQRSVQKEIDSWYGRFAKNNQISLADARKLLTTGQLEEFRWTVDQYIKAGQLAGADAAWLKKLENASARVHISRLEAIQIEIQQQLELLYGNQVDELDGLLKKIVGNGYTHTAYEVQKGLGLGWDMTAFDQQKLESLISKPWTTDGRTFRDRCWVNKTELVNTINTQMVQGMLRGDSPERTIQAIQKQFGVSRYRARRLVHTETSYFNACSALQSYRDLGIEQVEILGTLDSRTCGLCGDMDGKVIPLTQYEPGVTVPPWHPNCRCTTCPCYDDMDGERAARNAEGEVYHVPANMKYADWKKAFVEDGAKDSLTVADAGAILKLSFDEERALKEYISSGAYKVNAPLRGGQVLSAELRKQVENLDAALQKLPVYRGRVYRSITDFDIDDMEAFWAGYMPENIIQFPAYISTGTAVYDDSFPIQYVIESKNGRDVRGYNPEEFEILFPRNSEFRVVKVENGVIFMEEA